LNFVQNIFPGGAKIFLGGFCLPCAPLDYGPDGMSPEHTTINIRLAKKIAEKCKVPCATVIDYIKKDKIHTVREYPCCNLRLLRQTE